MTRRSRARAHPTARSRLQSVSGRESRQQKKWVGQTFLTGLGEIGARSRRYLAQPRSRRAGRPWSANIRFTQHRAVNASPQSPSPATLNGTPPFAPGVWRTVWDFIQFIHPARPAIPSGGPGSLTLFDQNTARRATPTPWQASGRKRRERERRPADDTPSCWQQRGTGGFSPLTLGPASLGNKGS